MEDVVLEEVKRLSEKYNKKEKVIAIMFKKCQNLGFSINETKENIEEFVKNEKHG